MTTPALNFPVFDAHVDLVYLLEKFGPGADYGDLPPGHASPGPVTPRTLAAGNVRVIVNALYSADAHNGPKTAAPRLRALANRARRSLRGLRPVMDAATLRDVMASPGAPVDSAPGVILMIENADGLLEFPLEEARELGVRVVGLTHAGANRIADGNAVANPVGFTAQGRELIGRLATAKMAVDAAHLSRPALAQLWDILDGPVCATHTGFTQFLDIPRNLEKTDIARVLERGGVVGLALAPELLAPQRKDGSRDADLEMVFRHVDWFAQTFGASGVSGLGIGSDFCGFSGQTVGLEDAGKFPALARRLLRAGYAEPDVRAIFGGNWLRFYERLFAA